MKKGKFLLGLTALVAAIVSAFAFNVNNNRVPGNIYTTSNCSPPVKCIKSTINSCPLARPYYSLVGDQCLLYTGTAQVSA